MKLVDVAVAPCHRSFHRGSGSVLAIVTLPAKQFERKALKPSSSQASKGTSPLAAAAQSVRAQSNRSNSSSAHRCQSTEPDLATDQLISAPIHIRARASASDHLLLHYLTRSSAQCSRSRGRSAAKTNVSIRTIGACIQLVAQANTLSSPAHTATHAVTFLVLLTFSCPLE